MRHRTAMGSLADHHNAASAFDVDNGLELQPRHGACRHRKLHSNSSDSRLGDYLRLRRNGLVPVAYVAAAAYGEPLLYIGFGLIATSSWEVVAARRLGAKVGTDCYRRLHCCYRTFKGLIKLDSNHFCRRDTFFNKSFLHTHHRACLNIQLRKSVYERDSCHLRLANLC